MTALYATFTDRATVYRHGLLDGAQVRQAVYQNIPCGLSRTAHTHSPTPVTGPSPYPKVRYRLKLYTEPQVAIALGDYIEVTHGGRLFWGYGADSFCYDTHSVCVMTVEGVQ